MFKDKAIRIVVNKPCHIVRDKVYDTNREIIEYDEALVKEKVTELQAEYDALQYQRDRLYPQIGEQLDMLFHDMTAGKGSKTGEWYKAIAKVKADHPKEAE